MLAARRCGMPDEAVQTHADCLRLMKYAVKTVHGISEHNFKGTPFEPRSLRGGVTRRSQAGVGDPGDLRLPCRDARRDASAQASAEAARRREVTKAGNIHPNALLGAFPVLGADGALGGVELERPLPWAGSASSTPECVDTATQAQGRKTKTLLTLV